MADTTSRSLRPRRAEVEAALADFATSRGNTRRVEEERFLPCRPETEMKKQFILGSFQQF